MFFLYKFCFTNIRYKLDFKLEGEKKREDFFVFSNRHT